MLPVATVLILVLSWVFMTPPAAEASWLIDAARYHISVHGQMSCLDCHGDNGKQTLHPNPIHVTKKLGDFFSEEKCSACHDDTQTIVESGTHGGIKVTTRDDISQCLRCHDPHYEFSKTESWKHFDSSKPVQRQCGVCHEKQAVLPDVDLGAKDCAVCHLYPQLEDPDAAQRISKLCSHCHGLKGARHRVKSPAALIDMAEYQASQHYGLSCLTCHPDSARFEHTTQETANCRDCHPPHDEKVAHDGHSSVTCEACHLMGIKPVRDTESKIVLGQSVSRPGQVIRVHNLVPMDRETLCRRCHFRRNQVGAVAVILPAKSIMCMPCHAATFSIGDTVTIIAMIVFLLGILGITTVWLSGSLSGEKDSGLGIKIYNLCKGVLRTIFSSRIFSIVKVLFLDALLQRRLYRQSRTRWVIHALIFYPFVFRFFWGLIALISSLWIAEWPGAWNMLDKNFPAGAFLFDLSGVMVISGILCAIVRGVLRRSEKPPGLPTQDWTAQGLMSGIIIFGFVLEGLRIAMTGSPPGSGYAFLGYGISRLFTDVSDLTGIYGYIWYAHAILTGAFVAYLPFSRMLHILLAPVSLVLNAASQHKE